MTYRGINALAETVNGLYKTELIRGPDQRPWRNVDDVELATLGWVHWHNTQRLHSHLGDTPPQSSKRPTLADKPTTHWLETNKPSLHQTQCDSEGGRPVAASLRFRTSGPHTAVPMTGGRPDPSIR